MTHEYKHASGLLQRKREQLIAGLAEGLQPEFNRRHALAVDDYFRESYESSLVGPALTINRNPYAIIALGGYGREEHCVHSDIDLLFLFRKNIPEKAEELIREMIYPLWDIGLEVGYAIRSLKECVRLAGRDFDVLFPLLDARFVCGMSPLYSELLEQVRIKLLHGRAGKIMDWLVSRSGERHLRYGDSSYRLEPNLKEGQGGLRDYHTLLWIGRIKYNLQTPRDLEYLGVLSHAEYQQLERSLALIWHVRNRLHMLSGRKCDQLHFEFQADLAHALGFYPTNGQKPVERFLGELHAQMETVKQQHLVLLYEQGYRHTGRRPRKFFKQTTEKGLKVDKGMLHFAAPEAILEAPQLLIKIFEESARLDVPLSAEARRLIGEFGTLVDADYRRSPAVVKMFEKTLATVTPTFNVLNEMLNTGFLVKLIPEYQNILNRIQYDAYHLFPVDRHSLRTVQTLKAFGTADGEARDPLCARLYRELGRRNLLLWAALLHDIGKGAPGESHSRSGAELVSRILTRMGLRPRAIETVAFLVREHLLLIKTATRRDVNDEETAILCARRVKNPDHLKMLYLLTVADSMATGPKAWNDWTAALLRDFFLKVLSILERGELASREATAAVEAKRARVGEALPELAAESDALLSSMSPRYLLYTPVEEIMDHVRLYGRLGPAAFVWQVTPKPEANTRLVTICARDCPGLFSKISGVFTLNSLDILDAQVYTWRNHIALDIFEVKPPPDQIFEAEKWARAEGHLEAALAGRLDLSVALREKMTAVRTTRPPIADRPCRIVVDNQSSSFFTIVEVFAYDYPGLLFTITDALFRCRLDIWVAKIATKVDQVVDVFYVRDFDGQKVDAPDQVSAIQKQVAAVLACAPAMTT